MTQKKSSTLEHGGRGGVHEEKHSSRTKGFRGMKTQKSDWKKTLETKTVIWGETRERETQKLRGANGTTWGHLTVAA